MENAKSEPSMEEILASIRRIISEDEDDTVSTAPAPEPTDAPSAKAVAVEADAQADDEDEDDAELALENVASPEPDSAPRQTLIETEDLEMIKKNVAEAIDQDSEDAILDESTAAAASQAFQNLSQTIRVSAGEGQTLEDLVVVMLRPMIKDWLNENLPSIVQEKVEEEVQRVSRRRR